MAKKLVSGGLFDSVLSDNPKVDVSGKFMNIGSRWISIYPNIDISSNSVYDGIQFNQHFMMESIVEAEDSFVYVNMRYIADIKNSDKSSITHLNDFNIQFSKVCDDVKIKYKG